MKVMKQISDSHHGHEHAQHTEHDIAGHKKSTRQGCTCNGSYAAGKSIDAVNKVVGIYHHDKGEKSNGDTDPHRDLLHSQNAPKVRDGEPHAPNKRRTSDQVDHKFNLWGQPDKIIFKRCKKQNEGRSGEISNALQIISQPAEQKGLHNGQIEGNTAQIGHIIGMNLTLPIGFVVQILNESHFDK